MADFKNWNMAEFRRVRNSPGMTEFLRAKGEEWVKELNAELHAAQAKRRQPVEDGYEFDISHGTRARLHIGASTARGQVHEDEHGSILKLMRKTPRASTGLAKEYAERANETKQRKAVFLSHVRAFTNAG